MYEEYLKFAVDVAKEAGSIMREYFNSQDKKIEIKSDNTPVTIADKMINDLLIKRVKEKYPEHSVDGEEQKYTTGSNHVWVCDPIDGTSMFTHHVPVSTFSLALVIDGEPVVGAVYDPYLDEMYTAIKGEGAYCNGEKIHVNNIKYGQPGSYIDCCMWYGADYDTLPLFGDIRVNNRLHIIGSTVHASMLVAKGAISAEIFPGSEHGHCDMAASVLIVREAGGKVTNLYGEDQRYDGPIQGAVLSNGIIHDDILNHCKKYFKKN